MPALIAKIVPDSDGQAVLFPEGHNPFACDEVTVERRGDEVILRPVQRPRVQDQEQD